jgi:hypothetical protein
MARVPRHRCVALLACLGVLNGAAPGGQKFNEGLA